MPGMVCVRAFQHSSHKLHVLLGVLNVADATKGLSFTFYLNFNEFQFEGKQPRVTSSYYPEEESFISENDDINIVCPWWDLTKPVLFKCLICSEFSGDSPTLKKV